MHFRKFVLLFLVALLYSCAQAPAATPTASAVPATETPSVDYTALVQDFWTILNDGDVDSAANFIAEDAVFTLHIKFQRHLQPEPIEGKAAIVEFLRSSEWEGIIVEPTKYDADGGHVAYNCKIYSGGGLLASGSTTSSSGCVIIVEGDLIVFIGDQAQELLYFNN